MVNVIDETRIIQELPRLHALTLADDGSPVKDKTVSHAIKICIKFVRYLGTRITITRFFY
jgi:hypothetical protein